MQIKITLEEVKALVRDKYMLPEDIEVEIVVDSDGFENNTKPEAGNKWIEVPSDWDKPFCPGTVIKDCDFIAVQYRNSETEAGVAGSWGDAWIQENLNYDIVKYLVISLS